VLYLAIIQTIDPAPAFTTVDLWPGSRQRSDDPGPLLGGCTRRT